MFYKWILNKFYKNIKIKYRWSRKRKNLSKSLQYLKRTRCKKMFRIKYSYLKLYNNAFQYKYLYLLNVNDLKKKINYKYTFRYLKLKFLKIFYFIKINIYFNLLNKDYFLLNNKFENMKILHLLNLNIIFNKKIYFNILIYCYFIIAIKYLKHQVLGMSQNINIYYLIKILNILKKFRIQMEKYLEKNLLVALDITMV